MKPTFSNLRNIALGLCLTQVVSAANAQEVVAKINDKASTSKDSIERILDRVMANINKDNKLEGPIYKHATRNIELYGDQIAKIILTEAHKYANRYLKEGNTQAYYAFMILSLTVPNQEGLMVHFREVPADRDYCNDDRAQGKDIVSSTAKENFQKALNGKKSFFRRDEGFLVKCSSLRGEDTYKQLIVGGSDGSDVGMFQLSARWHYDEFLKEKKYESVTKTIDYGLSYLANGFRRGLRSNSESRPCFFNEDGELDYKNLIRGSWSAYNGGPAQLCRFADEEGAYAGHDRGFLKNLNATFNLKNGGHFGFAADSELILSDDIKAAIDEVINNLENNTNNRAALEAVINS